MSRKSRSSRRRANSPIAPQSPSRPANPVSLPCTESSHASDRSLRLKTYLSRLGLIVSRIPLRRLLRMVRHRAGRLAKRLARWLGRHGFCVAGDRGQKEGRGLCCRRSSKSSGLPAEIEILVRARSFGLELCVERRKALRASPDVEKPRAVAAETG